MKKVLSIMLFLSLVVLSFAQPAASKITVVIKNGKFSINKDDITDGWKKDAAVATLGLQGDRQRVKTNTTHTYDDFGIVLFEKNENGQGTGTISEIQFYTGVNDSTFIRPVSLFTGKMQIEGLQISNSLSWNDVKEKLENFKETPSYMAHSYRLAYKGLYIYFLFNDEETTLRKISVGKDMRYEQ